MPEFTRDNCAPLGQEFFDSMDRVDESALARLIVEMQLNKLQDLPDLRTLFFRRKQQQMNYVASQYGRIPAYRAVQQQYTPVRGKPWAMHAWNFTVGCQGTMLSRVTLQSWNDRYDVYRTKSIYVEEKSHVTLQRDCTVRYQHAELNYASTNRYLLPGEKHRYLCVIQGPF